MKTIFLAMVLVGCSVAQLFAADSPLVQVDREKRVVRVTAEATKWLYDKGVRVMGIDAWGWDIPLNLQAQQAIAKNAPGIFWAAHQADLAYSHMERLTNLGVLPGSGFTVACFPLKIQGASAAPTRVVAIMD